MKKILLFVSALAGLFLAGSCQREELAPVAEGNVVTFEVAIPEGAATKAVVDDGSNINDLVYAVYRTAATTEEAAKADTKLQLIYQKNFDGIQFRDGKTTIPIELINDQNYLIVFWAQVDDVWVVDDDFDFLNGIVYPDEVDSNDESRAAFTNVAFLSAADIKGGAIKRGVTLYRPFAQINLGTTLPKNVKDQVQLVSSSMTVTGASAAFNVIKQVPVDTKNTITFTNKEFNNFGILKTVGEGENAVNYHYAAMNYIFAKGPVSVAYTITTAKHGTVTTEEVPNVPVETNYRTNILGNLLTSEASYTVELSDTWNEPAKEVELWDGKTIKEVTPNSEGVYEIDEPSELAWLAAAVNGTLPETMAAVAPQNFAGKIFKLTNDINLDNREWTPIGTSSTIFKGTFDGQDHVVSNLVINGGRESDKGLFGVTHDGEIKNLVIQNAKVSGRLHVGVVAGTPYTTKYSRIKVKGHVEVNGFAYVGGVGGHNVYADWTDVAVEVDETSYVKANSVENGSAYRTYVGGVAGFCAEGGHTHKNITSNINVDGSTCDVGGLFGIAHYNNKFENCSCSGNVSITTNEVDSALEMGGIAGVWHNENGTTVTFTDCSFTGELQTPNINEKVNFHNGGLVGSPYKADGTGKLIIDGAIYVATAAQLQTVLDAATSEVTIKFGADIVGNVTLYQKEGVEVTIDGNGKKYIGGIQIFGDNSFTNYKTTIKNINFVAKDLNKDTEACIYTLDSVPGKNCCAKNVTIDNCTFDGGETNSTIAAIRQNTGNANISAWTIKNCIVNSNMHSFLQVPNAASSVTDILLVENCNVYSKNGANLNSTCYATFTGCEFDVRGYAVRVGASGGGNPDAAKLYTFTNCTLKSANVDGDAVVIIRNDAQKATLNFVNTTLEGEVLFSGITENTKVTIDGRTYVAEGVTQDEAGEYYVSTGAGLKYMNEIFANKTAGKNVVLNLAGDIDFSDYTWIPVDAHNDFGFGISKINGKGYTISNLTINGQAMFTRFAGVSNGQPVLVKDVTFYNAVVNHNDINTAIIVGHTYFDVVLDNVDVKNSTITGTYKVAPLIGTVYNENPSTITATLKNCDVENTTVKATSLDFCTTGMVAFVYAGDNDKVAFENCTVSDVKLYAPNVYTAHAAIYTTGSETLFNEAEGVTVTNVTFENI